jgi:hypothetical protein
MTSAIDTCEVLHDAAVRKLNSNITSAFRCQPDAGREIVVAMTPEQT